MRMLPIFVCYDSDLDGFERRSISQAIVELNELFPEREIVNFGSAAWSDGDYSSADWYVKKAKLILRPGQEPQLDVNSIIRLLFLEPWQESAPHIDVLFTSRDLAAKGLNFCFGMTDGRYTVQSVYQYRSLNAEDRRLAIKTVLWHELGHVFGCAGDLRRSNTEEKIGEHCTNFGCVMRQGMSLGEWVRHAREAKNCNRIYCPQCMADARRSRV